MNTALEEDRATMVTKVLECQRLYASDEPVEHGDAVSREAVEIVERWASEDALDSLLAPLLADKRPAVRFFAAAHIARYAERAWRELAELRNDHSSISLDANILMARRNNGLYIDNLES